MASKTQSYIYDLLKIYTDSNLEANDFWVFCSDSTVAEKPVLTNSLSEMRHVLESAVFGKKVTGSDIEFMVFRNDWTVNAVYDEYSDEADLSTKNFFVITEPESVGGLYEFFKCIDNNNGAVSMNKPISNSTINALGGLYRLNDGYLWKYLGSVTTEKFRKFSTNDKAPITIETEVTDIATDGIYKITVENPSDNYGYERLTGTYTRKVANSNRIIVNTDQEFISNDGHYIGRTLIVTKTIGDSRQYTITGSLLSGADKILEISGYNSADFLPAIGDSIQILPRVAITGTGTGATAIAIFDDSNTKITGIRMVENGSGYKSATVEIIDPVSFDSENENSMDTRVDAKPVISPNGGHGANIVEELLSEAICMSVDISSLDPSVIPDNNTYAYISLIKNPEFTSNTSVDSFDNRIKIELSTDLPEITVVGDTITQIIDGVEISGIIHEIEGTDTIFITDYDGPYSKEFTINESITISGTSFDINTIEESGYISRTGEVLFINSTTPITRTPDNKEQIKFILSF